MLRLTGLAICMVAVSLSGCGRQDEPAANSTANGSRVSDDSVFKDQVRALEKAEDVQNTLNDAAARQRELIEKQAQ